MVMDRSTLGRNILLLERKRLITILVAVLHPPVAFRFFAGLYYVPAMPQPRPCRRMRASTSTTARAAAIA
jgi:hypothetical protein